MAEPQPDAAYAHPVAALFTIAFKVCKVVKGGSLLRSQASDALVSNVCRQQLSRCTCYPASSGWAS